MMEKLVTCDGCAHGAIVHEATGCAVANCRCRKVMSVLIEEALEAAKLEIRRDWHVAS